MSRVVINKYCSVAVTCAVISIMTLQSVIVSAVAGSLAIIFAVLSKQKDKKMNGPAKSAFIVGILGIFLSFAVLFGTAYFYLTDESYKATLDQSYKAMYGYTPEEYINQLTGLYSSDTSNQ